MNDITALVATMKAAAENLDGDTWHDEGASVYGGAYDVGDTVCYDHIVDCENVNGESLVAEFIAIANPANILALVEALEKAQTERDELRQGFIANQEEAREAIKYAYELKERLAHACAGREEAVREVEEIQKTLDHIHRRRVIWRGKAVTAEADISALRQHIASLESRTVTVKLPAEYLNADGSVNADMANTCPVVSAYREAHRAAGIQVIEGEG